jgi:formate dehydrogenase iron-sulfur subunit
MAEKAIYYDTTKCTACRACMVACKQWNSLPGVRNKKKPHKPNMMQRFTGPGYQNPNDFSVDTWLMMEFHTYQPDPHLPGNDRDAEGNWNFLRFACMHCTNAPCKAICDSLPYQAIQRSDEGFIWVDPAKCQAAACKLLTIDGKHSMCQRGCPFGVPRIGKVDTDGDGVKDKVVMRKCRACVDRLSYGLEPACVKTCGPEALQFGDRSSIVSAAVARASDPAVLAKYPHANVYGLDGPYGGSHVIYVLSQPSAFYGLPDLT